jgi:peptide/nickel transport system permease protein
MVSAIGAAPAAKPVVAPRRRAHTVLRRLLAHRGAVAGLAILCAYLLTAALSHVIAPYNPDQGSLVMRLQPPTRAHWLGTDELGRDILSRVLYGANLSLEIQLATVCLTMAIGMPWGLVAGYLGGWVDEVSMRVIDVMLAFPGILLGIGVAAIIGGGLVNVIIAVSVASVPGVARLVRGVVLVIRPLEFVLAGRAIGASDALIVRRHVLPNTVAPMVVQASLQMATVLLFASSLNFLGLGVHPPTADWGAMLANARDYMFIDPWVTTAPGVALTIVVVGFNLLGDGLRRAMDPRTRR